MGRLYITALKYYFLCLIINQLLRQDTHEILCILGRDTAGLGGKGGPYRLDAGHTVHQLSNEEKNAVPEHIKKAAREMGLRAFKQRLKDIKMSEYDHKLYSQFSDAVHNQVQALRVILGERSKL